MFLTEVLGTRVLDATGKPLGRIADLVVDLDDPTALVRKVLVSRARQDPAMVGWRDLSIDATGATLDPSASADQPTDLAITELLLRRDVLDTQVIDVVAKRVARVSDVLLTKDEPPAVTDVEVGSAAVLRRLGFTRLARHARGDTIAWGDLHLVSERGHELQLRTSSSRGVHRLDHEALATVVSRVPPRHAAEILHAVPHLAAKLAEQHGDPITRIAHQRYRLWRGRRR